MPLPLAGVRSPLPTAGARGLELPPSRQNATCLVDLWSAAGTGRFMMPCLPCAEPVASAPGAKCPDPADGGNTSGVEIRRLGKYK